MSDGAFCHYCQRNPCECGMTGCVRDHVADQWPELRKRLEEFGKIADSAGYGVMTQPIAAALARIDAADRELSGNHWASGICSAHQVPDGRCPTCNPRVRELEDLLARCRDAFRPLACFADQFHPSWPDSTPVHVRHLEPGSPFEKAKLCDLRRARDALAEVERAIGGKS